MIGLVVLRDRSRRKTTQLFPTLRGKSARTLWFAQNSPRCTCKRAKNPVQENFVWEMEKIF